MTVMRQVNSSNIKEIGYVEEARTLIVTFRGSGTYTYDDVPPEIDDELRRMEAAGESIGKYFHAAIRTQFRSVKLPPAPVAVA
jgi:KTSC domain